MPRTSLRQSGLWWRALLCVLVCAGASRAQTATPRLLQPTALAYDAAGDLFIADATLHRVFEATIAGRWKPVAGNGTQGFAGDGAPATQAQLNAPAGLAVGPDGTVYIADTGNHRLRAVGADGVIRTLAGDGRPRFAGDGGPAIAASLSRPSALALDPAGRLLICDTDNHRLRRVDPATGTISTLAGTGVQGFSGDGAAAVRAALDSPDGVAVAADGRIFVADTHNARVRVIDAQGTLTTFAGTGQRGFAGDGGPATAARLFLPRGLALDATGALLVADTGNQRIRRIDASGQISTVVGSGLEGAALAGASAVAATMRSPWAVAVSPFGWPAAADALNAQPRVLVSSAQLFEPAALVPARTDTLTVGDAIYGQGTVAVQIAGEGGAAAGSVSITQGGTNTGVGTVTAGSAAVAVPQLPAGTYPIVVAYGGDGIHPAVNGSRTLTVTPAAVTATANPASTVYGQTLPLLSGSLAGVLPQDASSITVSFSTAAPANLAAAGLYPIQASLAGPAAINYALVSQTAGELTILPAGSRATLSASAAGGYAGMALTLQATVASTTQGQPTGSVSFLDGGVTVATSSLSGGTASAVYASPSAGTHTLLAQYSGDANFRASTSAAVVETFGDLPDFSLTASGSTDQTVTGGGTVTYGFTVAGSPGPFTGSVLLSVGGLPRGATAVFSPVAVVPGSSAAAVTMTVTTTPLTAACRPAITPTLAVGWGVTAALLLGLNRRRGRLRGASLVALLALAGVLSGCGARTVDDTTAATGPQTFTLTVTGTGTNLLGAIVAHSAAVTLHVR